MESVQQSEHYDSLNLSNEPHIMSQIGQKQMVKYSTLIKKINEDKMIQQRIFLLTNEAIYNINQKSSLIKSLVSKLISMQTKYTIKRRIPLKSIYAITLSKSKQNKQFILHVINDYDYRYCTQSYEKKVILLKRLCQVYTANTGKLLGFYFKDQIVLIEYATRKCDLKSKTDRKPKEDPVFLSYQDFQQYELPDLNYQLQYSRDNSYKNISIKNFKPIFQIQQLLTNGKYYTVTTWNMELSQLHELMKLSSQYLLHPDFVFSSKNKIQLFTPFMIGGNLSRKLMKSVRISNQLAYFYIAQLILILQSFQRDSIFHGNFSLQNILIDDNGYLRIIGMDKNISTQQSSKVLYGITGYLPYIAPEMILVNGYGFKVNIWKLGVCAYKLLTGRFPFEGTTVKKTYADILGKHLKSDLPSFLYKMLEKDPSKRITLQQLKDNPKFKGISWQLLKEEKVPAPYQPDASSWTGNLPSIVQLGSIM